MIRADRVWTPRAVDPLVDLLAAKGWSSGAADAGVGRGSGKAGDRLRGGVQRIEDALALIGQELVIDALQAGFRGLGEDGLLNIVARRECGEDGVERRGFGAR